METLYKEIVWRVTLGSVKAPGPYQSESINKNSKRLRDFCYNLNYCHNNTKHPPPYDDGIRLRAHVSDYLYGFSSREQFRKWFSPDERISLKAHGFSLFCVEVSEPSIKGNRQTAFLRDGIVAAREVSIVRGDVKPCTKRNPCPVCESFGT